MVFVLKNVTLMSLGLFNDHLICQCSRFWLLNELMYLIVDGGMVQQVYHLLLLSFLLPLAPPDSLLDAEIQISHCLQFVLSEVCQVSISEMPKWSWLFEAFLESIPYLVYLLTVFHRVFKSVAAVVCFIHLLPQVWGPTASPQVSGLPQRSHSYTAWRSSMQQPCQLLSSSSPDTSPLGPMAWFLQLDSPFRTTKGNWLRAVSVMVEDSYLMFGMYLGMLRQCPLVMAYRGRTDRDWIIEVTMCCPERTG